MAWGGESLGMGRGASNHRLRGCAIFERPLPISSIQKTVSRSIFHELYSPKKLDDILKSEMSLKTENKICWNAQVQQHGKMILYKSLRREFFAFKTAFRVHSSSSVFYVSYSKDWLLGSIWMYFRRKKTKDVVGVCNVQVFFGMFFMFFEKSNVMRRRRRKRKSELIK